MDVVRRLRLLIWVLLLALWGITVYQYLGEEDISRARMHQVANPYSGVPPPPAPQERAPMGSPEQVPPSPAADSSLAMVRPPSPEALPPSSPAQPAQVLTRHPAARPQAPEEAASQPEPAAAPAAPPGFSRRDTRHFTVYAEGAPPAQDFLKLVENLHENLMLDLAPFSPWAKQDKVLVFLFKNQDTYRRMTGRPAWSGGASSVPKRRIYLYESSELPGILAHELCHIYYDGFFPAGRPNPLWLSEGMATLIQIERGLAAPSWLRENLELIEKGGGYPLVDLMAVSSTTGADDAKVRLWYAQSYSVVRFLVRAQQKSSFYKFSQGLREGRSVTEALYRAYGMPYNRIKALEFAWRYDMRTNRLSRLSSTPARL